MIPSHTLTASDVESVLILSKVLESTDSPVGLTIVFSPMVGIFYRNPAPSEPFYVKVGDRIKTGQTLAIIEAMKVFNEITLELDGEYEVVASLVEARTGILLQDNKPLFLLRKIPSLADQANAIDEAMKERVPIE